MSPPLTKVLEFLAQLVIQGKAYRTVNIARSMLSSTLGRIDCFDIGKHPLEVKLMKGAHNKSPSVPKYSGFLDVRIVVYFLTSLGPNEVLSFARLSNKLAILLALSTSCMVSELASIAKDFVAMEDNLTKFSLSKQRKTQRAIPLQVITKQKLQPLL